MTLILGYLEYLPGVVSEVLGPWHYMVEVFGNLWKRHVDQPPRRPVGDIPPANSPLIQRHLVPIDMTSLVGQPGKIISDSFIPSSSVPTTAASDESPSMDSYKRGFPEGSVTSSSCPVPDRDTIDLACSSSIPAIPVPAGIDYALTVPPDSTCKVTSTSTCTGKPYPTRTTRTFPSYLEDYELNW